MKCDELKRYTLDFDYENNVVSIQNDDGGYMDAYEVDEAIAELKEAIATLRGANEEKTERIVELQKQVDELKQKLEDAKATAYAESVDAGMRERRLKRALWLDRAEKAYTEYFLWNHLAFDKKYAQCKFTKEHCNVTKSETNKVARTPREWADIWYDVEYKCRAKAEEYK